jgi:phosphatidate cytidylyltransferase
MYYANLRADKHTARERWLKYFTYVIITALVTGFILAGYFFPLAVLIIIICAYEFFRTAPRIPAAIIFSVVSACFIFFAYSADKYFQCYIYFLVLTLDAFSQLTGQVFGKNKLAPVVSPTKTMEGLSGGIIFCMLSSLLAAGLVPFTPARAVIYSLAVALFGAAADLLASYYKRLAGIKDYSNFLPGQGGFLDRFDSFIGASILYVIYYFL